jgi:hypothetical protein
LDYTKYKYIKLTSCTDIEECEVELPNVIGEENDKKDDDNDDDHDDPVEGKSYEMGEPSEKRISPSCSIR